MGYINTSGMPCLRIGEFLHLPDMECYAICVYGDRSGIRKGSILIYPDGKKLVVKDIGTMCGGIRRDSLDLLVKGDFDERRNIVFLKPKN